VQTLTSYRNVDVEQQMSQVLTLLQHLNLEVIYYRVCHGFRQTKWDNYFRVSFGHFWNEGNFWGRLKETKVDSGLQPNHQVSISSTLYALIFCMNIGLAAFSSYMYVEKRHLCVKFVCLTLMKLTTGVKFRQSFKCSFYSCRSQKCKKDWQLDCTFLRFWDPCV